MPEPGIVFAAFEPSGDALAAPVIEALRKSAPDVPIWALGGPRMQASGAEMIGRTTDHPVMLGGSLSQVAVHHRRLRMLRNWLSHRQVKAFIPVDSPAANWSICRLMRRTQCQVKIIHLAAPQLWAWAAWRISKMRRLSDHVLCLLPFEPAWFTERGLAASFVGHPLFQGPGLSAQGNDTTNRLSGEDGPKLALLPGSRPSEIRANWPMMARVFEQLRQQHPGLQGLVAAANDSLTHQVKHAGDLPDRVAMRSDDTNAILAWADIVLVVSGTATLQAAVTGKPMVIVFNVQRWAWQLAGRWIIQTRTFSLPNLIAQSMGLGRIVPELVPHFGQVEPVVRELDRLLCNHELRRSQQRDLVRISQPFETCHFASRSCNLILQLTGYSHGRGQALLSTPADHKK